MTYVRPLIERAARLAISAHATQTRKDDGTPYIVHPFLVALKLCHYDFSETVQAAALVHDVLEDTEVSAEQMEAELGSEVLALVQAVSNDDSFNWVEKKKAYIESVRTASDDAKAIATADKIQNAESLLAAHAREGVDTWKHFNAGKEKKLWFEQAMLTMLQETWAHPLVDEYAYLVEKMNALD